MCWCHGFQLGSCFYFDLVGPHGVLTGFQRVFLSDSLRKADSAVSRGPRVGLPPKHLQSQNEPRRWERFRWRQPIRSMKNSIHFHLQICVPTKVSHYGQEIHGPHAIPCQASTLLVPSNDWKGWSTRYLACVISAYDGLFSVGSQIPRNQWTKWENRKNITITLESTHTKTTISWTSASWAKPN